MKPYEKIKENQKKKLEDALVETQARLNFVKASNASERIIKVYEKNNQCVLDNLENLDDFTKVIIQLECTSVISSMQRIYDRHSNEYYSKFDDLVRFYFGYSSTYSCYDEYILKSIRASYSGFADLDDIRKYFFGKNPYEVNVMEEWINYYNACYGTNMIFDELFDRYDEIYLQAKENTSDLSL